MERPNYISHLGEVANDEVRLGLRLAGENFGFGATCKAKANVEANPPACHVNVLAGLLPHARFPVLVVVVHYAAIQVVDTFLQRVV